MAFFKKVFVLFSICLTPNAYGLPSMKDRVYTADQNSNTVSVINPVTNTLLGQIPLGNPRPDILSPLYRGQINVHGLGFSPDHQTLMVISTGSNGVTFIDTNTNRIKATVYVGRSPHEGFFTPDGHEAWVAVRGEDYISVIDAKSLHETTRIKTTVGPGMIIFTPDGKQAFVCNSFNPVVEIVELASKKVVKKIPVVSNFSPFLQLSPDGREMWVAHKNNGQVTRIDINSESVVGTLDTGFITNHLGFATTPAGTFAYVAVGGENAVKVYTYGPNPTLMATIPVGSLPHGMWPSADGSRMYVGLEGYDSVAVIDTASNKVISNIRIGQAPQALVFVPGAVSSGNGVQGLVSLQEHPQTIGINLKNQAGDTKGILSVRNLGLVDALDVTVFQFIPNSTFNVYLYGAGQPSLVFKTDAEGKALGTAIGPVRKITPGDSGGDPRPMEPAVLVMEGAQVPSIAGSVLVGKQ